jgi:hypothetical protein
VIPLRGFHHWFTRRYTFPSCLPDPSRLVVPARPVVVRAAPAASWASSKRLPSASPSCCDRLGGGVLSPPHGHLAPRGAHSAGIRLGCTVRWHVGAVPDPEGPSPGGSSAAASLRGEIAVPSWVGQLGAGASRRWWRRRRSAAVWRWSSQTASGPSGHKSPSGRPSTTSVNRQLVRPAGATARACSCSCRSAARHWSRRARARPGRWWRRRGRSCPQ